MPSYLLALLVLLLLLAGAAPARAQGEQEGQPTPAEDSTGAEAEEDEELDLGVIHVEADALPPPAPAPAPAEEVEEEEAPEAEPEAVEVVPTGPAVEAVIERERLEATAADSLDEVLQRESGFVVNDTFAGSEASYQGLPGKFSAVTVDGQRLPGQLFDQVDFGQLQLGNVERVEVIRGPQAAAYGPDTAGVVVNLIPRAPEGEGGVLTAGVGTLGFNRQHLLLYNGHRMRDWTFSLERSLRESYDLSTTFPDTDGDSYRRYNFAGTYNVRRGSDELRLRAEYFDEDSNGAGFSPPNLVRVLDADTQRWQAAISYKWSLGDCESLTLSNNYGSYEHDLERFFADFPETRQQTGFTDALWDTRLAWRYEGRTTWQAGVERSWDRIESDRIAVGEAESTRYGGYATAQWESGDWTFDAAARVDSHEEFGTAVSPKLAATLQLDEYSTLAFGAGMGYRAPSLRERYYEFASPFGYTVLGNPDLEPERSTSYTFDYNRATQRTRLALGAFHHDVENLITFTQTQAIPQVFMTENVTRARSTGFTVGTERRWLVGGCADCSPRWFGLGYDGTFLTESEDEELGTRLANAPRTDHRLRAFYRTPDYNAEAVLRALGSRYLDRENATQAPAYETLDLSFSHTVGDGTWRVAGLNVLDEKNGRFGPEPGRELRVEYTLEF